MDYHFIIKDLAEEFEGEFTFLEKILKNITFSVPIKKSVTRFGNNKERIHKNLILQITIY